jgi:hypothetical protein
MTIDKGYEKTRLYQIWQRQPLPDRIIALYMAMMNLAGGLLKKEVFFDFRGIR